MGLLNDFSPGGVAVPTSDTEYNPPVGIYVGVAGDVKIDTLERNTITVPVQAGTVLPWAVRKVYASGTTATSLFTINLN